ncbi:hypothetical protein [Streptomyces pristinaespiralis]
MAEVYAVGPLDALDGHGPHDRSHDGKQLIQARQEVPYFIEKRLNES